MKTNILLCMIIGLVFLSMTYVTAEDLYYKQNSLIDLKIPCYNNGTYCSGAATCNLTINYPNGTNMVYQGIMTNQISYHNYTLNDSSVNGVYPVSMVCNDGGMNGKSTFAIYITPDGNAPSSTKTTMFVVLTIFFLILTISLFVFGIKSANLIEMTFAVLAGLGFLFFVFQLLMINPAVASTSFYDTILIAYKVFSIVVVVALSATPVFLIWGIVLEFQKKKHKQNVALGVEDD